jgi:hypothetical protein
LRRKKDLSKIRCFECHDFGNYASQCPRQRGKGRRKHALIVEVDEVVEMFHMEILLVFSLSSTVSNRGTWFVDSRAYFHMTGVFCAQMI